MFEKFTDLATKWVGSTLSIILHTVFFIGAFGLLFLGVELDTILLVLTTVVSLEAIYLALFIQRSVNLNTVQLEEVSEDVEDISEDVEEMSEDIEGIEKDLDELGEDIDEVGEELDELQESENDQSQSRLEKDVAELKKMMELLVKRVG